MQNREKRTASEACGLFETGFYREGKEIREYDPYKSGKYQNNSGILSGLMYRDFVR